MQISQCLYDSHDGLPMVLKIYSNDKHAIMTLD